MAMFLQGLSTDYTDDTDFKERVRRSCVPVRSPSWQRAASPRGLRAAIIFRSTWASWIIPFDQDKAYWAELHRRHLDNRKSRRLNHRATSRLYYLQSSVRQ